MTTTESKLEPIDRHGYHVTWCSDYGSTEYDGHDESMPYCYKQIAGVPLIAEGDVEKSQMWVNATNSFAHGQFQLGELQEMERVYDGVEIAIDIWHGPDGFDVPEQRFRITADVARTLAAALIRAADIKQGLTR